MDDAATYGPEFHRLPFSRAVEKDLHSDYKVVVLAMSERHVDSTLQAQVGRHRLVRVFHTAGAIHRPAGPRGTGGVRDRVWPRGRGAGRRCDAHVVSGVRVFGARC